MKEGTYDLTSFRQDLSGAFISALFVPVYTIVNSAVSGVWVNTMEQNLWFYT